MFLKRKVVKKVNNSPVMREAEELDYNKDGSVQINVGVKDVDDVFSPYAYKTYELANPEVIDYINMCEETISDREKITIDFYVETHTSNEEKKRIRQSIKRYYAEKIIQLKKRQKKNIFFGASYMLFGVLLLLVQSFFYSFFQISHTEFLVEVIGWLFLWDGLETIIGEWSAIGGQKKQCYHLLNSKIHVRQYSKKIQKEYGIGDYEEEE